MTQERVFCIRFNLQGKYYRFSTKKITVQESEAGDSFEIDYSPHITNIGVVDSVISYDGSWSVPSVSVSIWDGFQSLMSTLERSQEKATADVFYIDEKKERVDVLKGYAAEFSFENSVVALTVRSEDSESFEQMLTVFDATTFQTQQVFTPIEIGVGSFFEINENTSWTFQKLNTRRCRLRYSVSPSSQSSNLEEANTGYKEWTYNSEDDEFEKTGPEIQRFPGSAGGGNLIQSQGGYALISDVCTRQETPLGVATPNGEISEYLTSPLSRVEVVRYSNISFDSSDNRIRINFSTSAPSSERLKFRHDKGSAVVFYSNLDKDPYHSVDSLSYDYVFVRADGFIPSDINDASIRYGFLYAGQKGSVQNYKYENLISVDTFGESSPAGRFLVGSDDFFKLNLFHRYEIVELIRPDGVTDYCYLKLKIHNRGFGTRRHPYAPPRGGLFDFGCYEFPDWIAQGDPVKFVNHQWISKYMDYTFKGLSASETSELKKFVLDPASLNRLKGNRVDMLRNASELVRAISEKLSDGGGAQSYNDRLNNSANGKFGVVSQSSMYSKNYGEGSLRFELRERLSFNTSNNDSYISDMSQKQEIGDLSGSDPFITSIIYPTVFINPSKSEEASTNYLKFSSSEFQNSPTYDPQTLGEDLAKSYFRNNTYRMIHNPVPENAEDLGSNFPICYGSLRRVPMLHAVSKKIIFGQNVSSGDDFYVYASHQCNVSSEFDITLELLDEKGNTPREFLGDSKYLDPSNIIESPFPNAIEDHYYILSSFEFDSDSKGFVETQTDFIGPDKIYNPYHKLQNLNTSTSEKMYGIKLRGSEYRAEAGTLDRRFPIRNGVGSSKIYASFGGWKDDSGEYTGNPGSLITHPLDIIRHFNDFYGNFPNNQDMLDVVNLNFIKSKTPHHRASVFIRESMSLHSLIKKINQQFGYHAYFKNGRVYFAILDFESVDSSKPIAEGYNLLSGAKQNFTGYKDSYSEVYYKYNKNYVSDNFENFLVLNKNNNSYCASASESGGSKGKLDIDADYVYSSSIANEVASRIAKISSSKKAEYSISVRPVDGVSFNPGDYVPMTCSFLGMDNTPVLVMSVRQSKDVVEMNVTRFFF